MKPIYDFIVWALKRTKKATVPQGAILPITNNLVGSDGEWEYLMGTSGKLVTQSLLDERWKNYYSTTNWGLAQYQRITADWVKNKKTAADCQGLLDAYLQNDTNANGNFIKYCTDKGKITEINRPFVIGEAVFNGTNIKKTHVGWVCGFMPNGEPLVIHERGLAYGCVITSMSQFTWAYRGLMKNIFEYKEVSIVNKILKVTSPLTKGDDVKQLQVALNGLGYDCGTADGVCGQKTMAAIQAFAQAHCEPSASIDELQASVIRDGITYAGTLKRK